MLRATGTTVHAVHIEEIEERPYANVLVRGPTGEHNIKARLGEGLFAALRFGTPVVAAEDLVARLGVSLPADGRPLDERLDAVVQTVSARAPATQPERPRIPEPENLRFATGLERWELPAG